MGADEPSPEAKALRELLDDFTASEAEKLKAVKEYAKGLPEYERAILVGSLTAVRSQAKDEGYRLGYSAGVAVPTNYIERVEHMGDNKINSDNTDATIASGQGAAASKNTGTQQGANTGSGQAQVMHSQQTVALPRDAFDAAAFEQEIATVLHTMLDRIEQIETTDYGAAQEALATLKKADFSKSEKLADAHTMLEDLWDEAMRKKYSPLGSMFSDGGALADLAKAVPTLLSLLTSVVGG